MPSFKVFISSVQNEFTVEREALFQYFKTNALLIKFFEPVLFEKLPAVSQAPNKVYLGEVGESQIYLGIIGRDYGFEDSNGISPTEHEYNRAKDLAIQRWIFIKDGTSTERHPKEEVFLHKVSQEVSWKRFSNTEDLKQEVFRSCIEFLEDKGLISDKSFDLSPNTNASVADIDTEKIEAFVRAARSKRGFPLKEGALPEQVLAHLHMWNGQQLTNSALLVFGKKPQQFFPTAIIKCAHFHGTQVAKPIPDHKVFQGDVFEQVDQAVDFVLSKINVSVGTRDKSVQAPIEYEIPRAAVAEAIVNSVAHRDYHSNGSVQVMLFTDRLEITNPGRLSPELTLAQLRIEHPSYPTNPQLAECMYQAGYIERFGTGTLEIIRLSEEAHLNDPNFTVDGGFKVVLWRPAAKTDQVPDKYRTSTDQVTDHDTDEKPGKYRASTGQVPGRYRASREIDRIVIVLEGEMKRSQLQDRLELRHRDSFVENYLQPALDQGLIEMTIPDKPTSSRQRYRLTSAGQILKESLENK
jgi:ATP-dependent DNA helicase RecG